MEGVPYGGVRMAENGATPRFFVTATGEMAAIYKRFPNEHCKVMKGGNSQKSSARALAASLTVAPVGSSLGLTSTRSAILSVGSILSLVSV